ncbi:MAG: hypothetical protein AABZ55_03685 [Bdellovibrionota bacterium]
MDSQKQKLLEKLFEDFSHENTELDSGLYFLSKSVDSLEQLKTLSFECSSGQALELLKKAEEFISMAEVKFKKERFAAGSQWTARYQSLILKLKKELSK